MTQAALLPLVDAILPIAGNQSAPCYRPQRIASNRSYEFQAHWQPLAERGIKSSVAWLLLPHGTSLGTLRWVVERTFVWLNQFWRLRMRYEKRAEIDQAFLPIGCSLICHRILKSLFVKASQRAL